jgi:hypothetical protein
VPTCQAAAGAAGSTCSSSSSGTDACPPVSASCRGWPGAALGCCWRPGTPGSGSQLAGSRR